jgi:hypothetical protein
MSGQPATAATPALTPTIAAAAAVGKTTATQCAQSCMDYLLIALVQHYLQNQQNNEQNNDPQSPPLPLALDAIGFRVGRTVVERITNDRPPFVDQLDILKWICKDFWSLLFGHQIDNLRTNHRGTYVLRDTRFRWTLRVAQNLVAQNFGTQRRSPQDLAEHHLILLCAIIKGGLRALGIESTVSADSSALPQVEFTIVVMDA